MRISDQHLEHLFQHGYTFVEDFLTPQELNAAQNDLYSLFPSWELYSLAPALYGDEGIGESLIELPLLGDVLNSIAVHPDLIDFVERALSPSKIQLTQSLLRAKYSGVGNFDQPLHVDFMNNSLIYPRDGGRTEQITFLIYYVDINEEMGPTYVVPREHTKDTLLVPYLRPRASFPDLYRHELKMKARAGSMLIYYVSTFHRGSPIKAEGAVRFTHHINYGALDAPWVGYRHWANYGLIAEMQRFIERASPRQREMLNFTAG